jgi:hypothetical protein
MVPLLTEQLPTNRMKANIQPLRFGKNSLQKSISKPGFWFDVCSRCQQLSGQAAYEAAALTRGEISTL